VADKCAGDCRSADVGADRHAVLGGVGDVEPTYAYAEYAVVDGGAHDA
jgi:hypothetical protein